MIKRNNKKGFTIVELVIVIAVIAILAAVLIPTFSGIIKKANISSDTQLCKNMNTALSMAKAEGKALDTMEDVLFAINEAGYVIENLNPTTEGYYFAWDKKNGQILFLNEALDLHYPADATLVPADCWITVADNTEANTIAAKGFALYLEPNFEGPLTLANLVSVDAGANAGVALKLTSDTEGTIAIRGSYATVELAAPKAHVEQYGVIETATGAVASNSFVVNGFVKKLDITTGKIVVATTGVVNEITSAAAANLDKTTSKGIIVTGASDYTSSAAVTINNKAELEAFRDIVNGGYNYDNVTVTLNADIDLNGVAWLPIGNFVRGDLKGFSGTFDGNGHVIKNLSNVGFSVAGLALGSNDSTAEGKVEASYGLFGCVIGGEIKNITVSVNIDMVDDGAVLGDSVGAIVGFAGGESFTMTNCKATGTINGYDAVGGLVGRSYAVNVTVDKCVNEAKVTGIQKTAGIIGYVSYKGTKSIVNFTNCTSTGSAKTSAAAGTNYYRDANLALVSSGVTFNGTKLTEWLELDN